MSANQRPIDTTRLVWSLAALVAAAAPHLVNLPLWPMGLMAATVLWRIGVQRGGFRLPGVIVRLVLALAGFAGVFLSYRTINGLEAGSALLVVMSALKLTETRRVRDLVVIVLIGYFLIVTQFLFDQSMLHASYAIPAVWLLTTALLQIASPATPLRWRRAFSRSGVLLAQAMPLMLIAFVLFPRLSGPFWAVPRSDNTAVTGLADEMSPGSITRLLQSDAVAFRARFDGEPPPPGERYWRGPVLSNFDGRRWSVFQDRDRGITPGSLELRGDPITYEVTLEATQQSWLFALEQSGPQKLPRGAYMTNDRRLLRNRPVTQLFRYNLESWPDYSASREARTWELRRDLQHPDSRNPRAQSMARSWAEQAQQPEDVINSALRMFREQEYIYTLTPAALDQTHPVDDFLFSTRRGFCEHYASAFTLLMRAAGIPARVVIGYQGGQVNPYTGHMTVRQSDAHAWSEVWVLGRGWLRVDPTAAVAPERVELGLEGSLRDGESLPGLFRNFAFLQQMQLGWDAVNNGWNQWVLGFSRQRQYDLMRALGMQRPSLRKLLLTMIALVTVVLSGLAGYLLWRSRPVAPDPVARIYARFCHKLAGIAGPRRATEGPLDFASRIAGARPDLAASANEITKLYLDLRYHPDGVTDMVHFRRAVRGLRI